MTNMNPNKPNGVHKTRQKEPQKEEEQCKKQKKTPNTMNPPLKSP